MREIEEKNLSLKEHEARVIWLGEQLALLQKDLLERENSQIKLKGEMTRIEKEMVKAISENGNNKEFDLRKILEEILPKNFESLNRNLLVKDEEILKLREEIRFMSAHWKHKTKDLESQVRAFINFGNFIVFRDSYF